MLRVMPRGADTEELLGVIRHAYGTATPIERLYSIPQLPQSATEPVMPCTPSTNVALLGTDIAIISITWIALPCLVKVVGEGALGSVG